MSLRNTNDARKPLFREWHVDATAFFYEILRTADSLKEAKTFDGDPALHLGAQWRLVRAVERCGGAPTFADLARMLQMSRQAARESAVRAARAGLVELLMSPNDRRALQVALAPAGRQALERQRMPEFGWLFTLLRGLDEDRMRDASHVLEVIRRRLERQAAEMRAARRAWVSGASARRSRS
jgi:DNA-binding MarR family transcriptional regulator